MYLYFNSQGILKEIINDKPSRQTEQGNKINIYVEGFDYTAYQSIVPTFRFKNEDTATTYPECGSVTYAQQVEVPYNSKRDLKFFEYHKKYDFLVIPTNFTMAGVMYNVLEQAGNVSLSVYLNSTNITVLGLIVFNVEATTNGNAIQVEQYISLAQWDYLKTLIGSVGELKLDKNSHLYIKVVSTINLINNNAYKDYISSGDIVFAIDGGKFYIISGTFPSLTYVEISINASSIDVVDLVVENELRIKKGLSYITLNADGTVSMQDYLDAKQNQIPVVALGSLSGTITPSALVNSLAVFPSYLTYEYGGDKSVFIHCRTDSTYYYFRKLFKESIHDNNSYLIYGGDIYIQVDKSTGIYSQQSVQHTWYSKTESDALLNLKADKSNTYTKAEIDTKLTSMLVYKGSKTVAELNALSPTLGETQTGWFYNVTDSGVLNAGNVEVLSGDNVAWTGSSWDKITMDLSVYDDKFISAGFFSVEDYNENTGMITFVYASDLYSMAYSESTGILTIEAQ